MLESRGKPHLNKTPQFLYFGIKYCNFQNETYHLSYIHLLSHKMAKKYL